MADDIRISYSYQPNSTPPAAAVQGRQSQELFAFTNCERVDLDKRTVLLLNRENGCQMTVAIEVATALTYCTGFRPLAEHAQSLVDTIPSLKGQLADVTTVLKTVQGAGLMTEAGTAKDKLIAAPAPTTALPPSRVFIITCDRPEAVQRLLDSMLLHGRLAQHEELFLVDDSRDAANGERNAELVAQFNLTSPRTMRYIGCAAQGALLDRLVTELPHYERAIRFLIDRARWATLPSYGLARTLCLLLGVGRRCIILDDDIICRSVSAHRKREGISFGAQDQRDLASFSSEAELMGSASFLEADPMASHARCLGMPLSLALGALGKDQLEAADLRGVNAAAVSTLDANSRVLITQCGSWGDPGSPGVGWFFRLDKESLHDLLASSGGLAGAATRRFFWLGRTRPNISKLAVMSQATGLDNSALLPPYFPVFRGEDALFASMTLFLHPRSAVLNHDWCVPHLPLENRGGQLQPPKASRGGLALCARYLADRVTQDAGGRPTTRLGQLSAVLRELVERGPNSLLAVFRSELARENAEQLRILMEQLQTARELGSKEWLDYIQDGVRNVSASLNTRASPADIPETRGGLDEAQALEQVLTAMDEFSTALTAWPEIRESAALVVDQMLAAGDFTA